MARGDDYDLLLRELRTAGLSRHAAVAIAQRFLHLGVAALGRIPSLLPSPGSGDVGKVVTVNADHTGYELDVPGSGGSAPLAPVVFMQGMLGPVNQSIPLIATAGGAFGTLGQKYGVVAPGASVGAPSILAPTFTAGGPLTIPAGMLIWAVYDAAGVNMVWASNVNDIVLASGASWAATADADWDINSGGGGGADLDLDGAGSIKSTAGSHSLSGIVTVEIPSPFPTA